jgi:hypothetical protein
MATLTGSHFFLPSIVEIALNNTLIYMHSFHCKAAKNIFLSLV